MNREERDNYVTMIPRVFVRALRDPNGNEEYELSEGQATSLLMERERSLGAAHWRNELKDLCALIVERAHQEETSTHIAVTIEEPDGNFILFAQNGLRAVESDGSDNDKRTQDDAG